MKFSEKMSGIGKHWNEGTQAQKKIYCLFSLICRSWLLSDKYVYQGGVIVNKHHDTRKGSTRWKRVFKERVEEANRICEILKWERNNDDKRVQWGRWDIEVERRRVDVKPTKMEYAQKSPKENCLFIGQLKY